MAIPWTFTIIAAPHVVVSLSMLALGSAVLYRERFSRVGLSFMLFTASIAIGVFGIALVFVVDDPATALAYARVFGHFGVAFIPSTFLIFTLHVVGRYRELRWSAFTALAVSIAFYLGFAATDLFIPELYSYSWGDYTRYGPASLVFILCFFTGMTFAFYLFWREYHAYPSGRKRERPKELLLAGAVGIISGVDFFAVYGVAVYPFGYVFMLGFVVLCARAIWRHRLVDITPAFAAEGIISSMTDGLLVLDRDGSVRVVNAAACSIFGYGEGEMVGRPLAAMVPGLPNQGSYFDLIRVSGGKKYWEIAYAGKRHGDEAKYIDLSASVMPDRDGDIAAIVVIATDVTRRKKDEMAIRESNARLAEALEDLRQAQEKMIAQEKLRALGQMARGIAHDFNNSLTPIIGFTEMLQKTPGMLRNEERTLEFLDMIHTSALDAKTIVQRLRQQYRPDASSVPAVAFDLNRSISQTVALTRSRWQPEAPGSGKTIEVKTVLGALPDVNGNESEIREALTSLIYNSVDAMPEGGRITIQTASDGDSAVVTVEDTGVGMTEEVRSRCFEPFFSTKGERGTGMGLPMVAHVVREHRGTITVESEPGRGARFTVRLPFAAAQQTESDLPPP